MTKDEALKMALHTLVLWDDRCRLRVIAAIKEALDVPETNFGNIAAQEPTDIAALVEGMEVSIDVSTGEHDSNNRLFGTVTLAQENQGSKHGLILLVQDPVPNFKAQPAPVQEPVARVIDDGTPEGATEWVPFANRIEPLKTGDLLYTTPPAAVMGIPTTGDYAMGYAEGFNDACKRPAPPPPECKTEAEQTAYAFGWWKALESVRTEQPAQESVAHTVIAGALFDFMGYLTSRKERIVLSAADDTAPAADAIRDFATKRGLSLDDAQVREWIDALAQPAQEPVETWEDLHNALQRIDAAAVGLPTFEVRHEGGLDAVVQNIVDAIVALHEDRTTPPAAQPAQEPNNFCLRCGKRLQGVLGQPQMHTCTPPLWGHI